LWGRQNHDENFNIFWIKDGAHKRIVWSVDFCPLSEAIFASGSRDGSVKIWKIHHGGSAEETSSTTTTVKEVSKFSPDFQRGGKPDAVTAVAFAPVTLTEGRFLLAIGLESGRIEFWTYCDETYQTQRLEASLPCGNRYPLSLENVERERLLVAWEQLNGSQLPCLQSENA